MPTRKPTKPEAHPAIKPSPIRNLSEFAVADTPGTSGPEHAAAGDYLQARFAPMSPPAQQQQHHQNQNQNRTNQTLRRGTSTEGGEGDDREESGMPSSLEQGIRGGSGPVDDTERRATRYDGRKQNENMNVDADGRMGDVPYGEGRVADAVERKPGTQRQSGLSSSALGGGGGSGQQPDFQRLHGRGRGERSEMRKKRRAEGGGSVKKQQQAAARKQVMDARRKGEDVDGRGIAGSGGREPTPELDPLL
ncbi:hypothetical protein N658DRAFT_548481 [Parathielavia hyrcaniae]|uniref:Uncharacterized protein n=1 Tax=Parathielavia hyrcaniae TaxID=113614 RepID=A0AAN6PY20_9PEZI|nr:hypothetical protein N658DRAFT_548481 [Parathielavia hyrcaniae]